MVPTPVPITEMMRPRRMHSEKAMLVSGLPLVPLGFQWVSNWFPLVGQGTLLFIGLPLASTWLKPRATNHLPVELAKPVGRKFQTK